MFGEEIGCAFFFLWTFGTSEMPGPGLFFFKLCIASVNLVRRFASELMIDLLNLIVLLGLN